MWSTNKKKPICALNNAHGQPSDEPSDDIPNETWITSLAVVKSTDLVASGKYLSNNCI